ncbi:hypothetical protein M885DRAFT_512077 [Pelagophyceae sp. CCMP2097]|nr:hypothetical protein M885DRAFT_512077 [Pelagophyceae sp. CCMP2097]|mmetsp:Transcript_28799/g.99210  ORF Transcript_28799/g.99210 Transcript_28799/m.99210 type:complete len:349 (-) Transcript_28799:56-1102(-)
MGGSLAGFCGDDMGAARYKLTPGHYTALQTLMARLGIKSRDVRRLHGIYRKIDHDDSGQISMLEFLVFFDLERTRFADRVFLLMDADKSGTLDFVEFLSALFLYCTFSWEGLVQYSFQLCDQDDSGSLDSEEVAKLVRHVYGDALDGRVKTVLQSLDADGSGSVSYDEWRARNRAFPLLLFPAFHMQEVLRARSLGGAYWQRRVDASQKRGGVGDNVLGILKELDSLFYQSKRETSWKVPQGKWLHADGEAKAENSPSPPKRHRRVTHAPLPKPLLKRKETPKPPAAGGTPPRAVTSDPGSPTKTAKRPGLLVWTASGKLVQRLPSFARHKQYKVAAAPRQVAPANAR